MEEKTVYFLTDNELANNSTRVADWLADSFGDNMWVEMASWGEQQGNYHLNEQEWKDGYMGPIRIMKAFSAIVREKETERKVRFAWIDGEVAMVRLPAKNMNSEEKNFVPWDRLKEEES